jgi:MFS superfamily sulfate permease-like transporter
MLAWLVFHLPMACTLHIRRHSRIRCSEVRLRFVNRLFNSSIVLRLLTLSSFQLVTGPTTIMSVLSYNALHSIRTWGGEILIDGSALFVHVSVLMALMVALQQLALAAVGGASLARLMSTPIVVGFTSGSAMIIGASQVPIRDYCTVPIALLPPPLHIALFQLSKLFGVSKCITPDGQSCTVQAAISNIVARGGAIGLGTPLLSLSCLAFLLFMKYGVRRWLPARLALLTNTAPLIALIFTGES